MKKILILSIIISSFFSSCINAHDKKEEKNNIITQKEIRTGAERTEVYFPWIKDKNVAVVANQTSMIKNTHLIDSLLNAGIKIKKVFSPEHGFRGNFEAGEKVKNHKDKKTGLPIISLYGNNYKPKKNDLKGIDVIVFDIQDVGARFYTYISTMTYIMEACAENNIQFIILDRPNPNGDYIDGPVLEKKHKSFVGLHPVPIVYGMTIAEYASMVNNEGWLKNCIKCDIKFVKIENYKHNYIYKLPVKPSPNLPNMNAVYLYPSLCLFEGTAVSVGRGTDTPFELIGYPGYKQENYCFTPRSIPGVSMDPPYRGKKCCGYKLTKFAKNNFNEHKHINLNWLIEMYENYTDKNNFFNSYFDNLAGTANLRHQIINGVNENNIRKTWEQDISKFKKIRKKYLLYQDFE